jgi:hypothetical protein
VKPGRYETPDALSCWKAVALGGLFGGHRHCDACRYPDKAAQVVEKVISEAITRLT